jgi:protein-disulfide isomerase
MPGHVSYNHDTKMMFSSYCLWKAAATLIMILRDIAWIHQVINTRIKVLHAFITFGALILIFGAGAFASVPGVCRQPTSSAKEKAKVYIARRLALDPSDIAISADAPEQKTSCFSRLIVTDKVSQETFELFMSENGQFLTGELYDLKSDPVKEERTENEKIARLLREGSISTRESTRNTIDIVVFADLQCPYCRQIDGTLKHFLSDGHHDVRLIYKAYPIPSHPWAYKAAEIAACVQLQSTDTFWELYGYLLHNQPDITAENFRSRVDDWIKNGNTVDNAKLNTCVSTGQGKNLVDRDLALGRQLDVVATPTLFVNGARLDNPVDENMLQRAVLEAEHQVDLTNANAFRSK